VHCNQIGDNNTKTEARTDQVTKWVFICPCP